MAAAAILYCGNFKFLTVEMLKRVELRLLPNFVEIAQTAAEIWQFFIFFKMAAVRHLGLVLRVLGPPTSTWWSL